MPRVPAHLCECALGMLQGGTRTADVARAINCNVCTVRCLRQRYRETGRTADRPRSGRPRVTTPAQDWYIRTSHLRYRYRIATTTSQVTPGRHNRSISAQIDRSQPIADSLSTDGGIVLSWCNSGSCCCHPVPVPQV